MAIRVVPSLQWCLGIDGGPPLDGRLVNLLGHIEREGSLRAACVAADLPYRTAWGLLQDLERTTGAPLVRLARGRGATLTEDGAAILRADEVARRKLARELEALAFEVGGASSAGRGSDAPVLRLAASHDPALAALQDALPAAAGARLEIAFCGSLEALARFRAGDVDMAGFHYVPGSAATARPFLRHLRPARDRLLRFVDREQGLILPHGNPRGVRRLADVARQALRFINRQQGSGTRMLIDAQLEREGLAPADLLGYGNEEFTHAAVAATIASGRADAGVGVAAAAAEYDLDFVPLARERYHFAVREALLASPAMAALRASLKGPVFRELVGHMVGYDATHSGELERVRPVAGRRTTKG
jgi:molybdate transport repressor ModE-like protein